jgi:hypothetical protein
MNWIIISSAEVVLRVKSGNDCAGELLCIAGLTFIQRLTMRAPDVWESARFQAFCVASSWLQQIRVLSARPAAGNASRWAFTF